MPLLPRSNSSRPALLRLGGALLSMWLGLGPGAGEAAPKTRSSKSTKAKGTRSGSSKAAPSEASEPQPAPSAAPPESAPKAPEAVAPAPAPVPMPPPPAPRPAPVRPAPVAARPAESAPKEAREIKEAREGPGRLRLGLSPDLFLEGGRLNGDLSINASRRDESFDYSSAGFLSGTLWLNTSVPSVSERLRVGAGVRIFGNYGAGGNRTFGFGLLNELFVLAEYGLPVADRIEVVLGGRAGLSVLVPGQEFAAEIRRYQEQGVGVWSVPRVGWLVGPSVGARRRMTERILLRADIHAQVETQYLFATSQAVEGLYFTKNWSTQALRLGLSLGAEFGL